GAGDLEPAVNGLAGAATELNYFGRIITKKESKDQDAAGFGCLFAGACIAAYYIELVLYFELVSRGYSPCHGVGAILFGGGKPIDRRAHCTANARQVSIEQHSIKVAVEILNGAKIRPRQCELNEDVVEQVFGHLLVVVGQFTRPREHQPITLDEEIFVA